MFPCKRLRPGFLTIQVFLTTGTSSGIGIETARALAATGAQVFLAVRNVSKGEEACKDILEPGRVELLECDTSSLASVRDCAEAFLSGSKKLNGLILNAGIMMTPTRELTEDGFEGQLGTNYLGHFLLFWLLKDALLAGSSPEFQSRVVSVSSSGHHASEINFDDFQFSADGAYHPSKAYGQSKLAQIYMSNHIEREYGPKGIHALSLMPGGIATNLQIHMSQEVKDRFASDPNIVNFMKSTEQGAATTIYAALSKEWEGKGGKYLEDCQAAPPADAAGGGVRGYKPYAYDQEKEDRLWKLTLETLKLED